MKKTTILLGLFLIIGCGGIKPEFHDFEKKRVINGNFDSVWSAVIEIFAEENIPITNIEKASGLIVSDKIFVEALNCDCGKEAILGGEYNIGGCTGMFNVFVKKVDMSKTTVMITAKYISRMPAGKSCTSTGTLETYLFELIANKVESSK